jgi:hypothetical protein
MTANASLWPKDIENQRTRAPVAILREQASILGQITQNLVQGQVYTDIQENERFRYEFFIVSPPLANYQYQLLTMLHDVSLYPVEIYTEEAIKLAIQNDVRLISEEYGEYIKAETEEELLAALKAIFGAKKTVQVITALLSQADPHWKAKGDWMHSSEDEGAKLLDEDAIPF